MAQTARGTGEGMMNYQIIQGDCMEMLKTLPDESVNCCITSPPYWGLRSYGIGKENGELGSEETPEQYVDNMVKVFREVRRVLRKDGTVFLNLGDSYFSTQNSNRNGCDGSLGGKTRGGGEYKTQKIESDILKAKDLCGIPWRVAFALQDDGWYLRQDIIWAKPNPMPESVTDRCTKSHEYIFLLAKSQKYYYDAVAIQEKAVWDIDGEGTIKRAERQREGLKSNPTQMKNGIRIVYPNGKHKNGQQSPKTINGMRNKRSVWNVATAPFKEAHFATFPEALIQPMVLAGCPRGGTILDPFSGAGTTGLAAKNNGRQYIGIELNPEYIKISEKRLDAVSECLI